MEAMEAMEAMGTMKSLVVLEAPRAPGSPRKPQEAPGSPRGVSIVARSVLLDTDAHHFGFGDLALPQKKIFLQSSKDALVFKTENCQLLISQILKSKQRKEMVKT